MSRFVGLLGPGSRMCRDRAGELGAERFSETNVCLLVFVVEGAYGMETHVTHRYTRSRG